MKAGHRRWHAALWLLLAPALLFTIYFVDAHRLAPPPALAQPPSPSEAGVLP